MARYTVVYDGECPFCRRQVDTIRRRDRNGSFEYVPRQTPGLTERFPILAEGDFNTGMRLVAPDGSSAYVGADAVYQIARRLPGWRRLAWLYRVPGARPIARRAYAWIAANRTRLSRARCDKSCEPNNAPTNASRSRR